MITFQITYDESIPKCTMRINNHPLRGDSKLNDYINTPLERWIDYLLYQLPVETNDRDIHILFSGSDEGYELVRKHVQENLATRKDAQFTVMRKSEYFSHTKENGAASVGAPQANSPKELYTREKNEMEALVQGLEGLSFDVLWMRKEKINEIHVPAAEKEPFLSFIDSAIVKKEHEELDAICDEIVNYDLKQCDKLKNDITQTLYSKVGIESVVAQIEKRKKMILEEEQVKELERLFSEVETFDKDKLNELEAYLRSGKYLSHLIEPYTTLVDQRKEALSREEVELLCGSYLNMSLEELAALKGRLLSGEFEEIYALTYAKLIEVRMDELAVKEIEKICQNMNEDKTESADFAVTQLAESGYKERLWKPYEVALRIQKVYLEKLSLVKKCNDFNQLTQSEAMHLLEWVKEQEINEGTKQAYSQCLIKRIHNIQGLAVYRYSAYLQSLLKNTQVGNMFCLTLISKDYYPKIQELRKTFKEFDDYSMPIGIIEGNKTSGTLIFKDCLMFQEQGLTKVIPLSEVRNIEANKKMLQAQVVITTHNGPSHPLLTVMGHKKGEEVAKVLLTLIDTIRTRVSLPNADAPEVSLPLWSRSVGEPEKLDHVITIEKVIQRFLLTLNQIDEPKVKYVSTYSSADWQKKLDKARENFAKYSMDEIPFVLWDASKGNLRYGMCITNRRIYVKTAGGKEYDVSLGQIYEIIPSTTEMGVSFLLKLTDTKIQELPFEAMEPELAMKWKTALEDVLEGILECQSREMIQSLIAQRPTMKLEENLNVTSTESMVRTPVEMPVPDAVIPEKEIEIPEAEPLIEEEVPVFVPTPDPVFTRSEEPQVIEPEIIKAEVVEESAPEPEIIEPEVVEESVPEPEIIEPEVVEESVPEPEIIEPEIVEESVPEPEVIEPEEQPEVFVEASEESFLDIDALIDRIISGE